MEQATERSHPTLPVDRKKPDANYSGEIVTHLEIKAETAILFEWEGDSMINAFIPAKAYLIVDKEKVAKNGDIIIASVDGRLTVRYLQRNEYCCKLLPANRKYEEIAILPQTNFQIYGVVTHIVSKVSAA